jgi:hypothetical protein
MLFRWAVHARLLDLVGRTTHRSHRARYGNKQANPHLHSRTRRDIHTLPFILQELLAPHAFMLAAVICSLLFAKELNNDQRVINLVHD